MELLVTYILLEGVSQVSHETGIPQSQLKAFLKSFELDKLSLFSKLRTGLETPQLRELFPKSLTNRLQTRDFGRIHQSLRSFFPVQLDKETQTEHSGVNFSPFYSPETPSVAMEPPEYSYLPNNPLTRLAPTELNYLAVHKPLRGTITSPDYSYFPNNI